MNWPATVARHFQRAADTYADASALQRASTHDFLANCRAQGVVLELGAGQGELAAALATRTTISSVIALDVSDAMLRVMPHTPRVHRVVASALAIPLAPSSVDAVLSHFALHWCLAPTLIATELRRVLRRGGMLQLAIPVAGSLAPLHGSAGDGALLLPVAQWQRAFSDEQWLCVASSVQHYTRYFASARQWLAYLRAMGVTAKPQAPAGLAGKRAYGEMIARIGQAAEPQGIPFTFQVWHVSFHAR